MTALRFATAREVFAAFPQAAETTAASPTDEAPPIFTRALAASDTPEDAITFCAYALGRREAVWWACQCIRMIGGESVGQDAFLAAAELWVRAPEETNRRAALAIGTNSDKGQATHWLALAAGWSGGSISPFEGSAVPAPPHLTATAVRAAVLIVLARVERKERASRLSACIEGGLRLMEPAAAGAG